MLSIHQIHKKTAKENLKFDGTFEEAKQKTKELVEESVNRDLFQMYLLVLFCQVVSILQWCLIVWLKIQQVK